MSLSSGPQPTSAPIGAAAPAPQLFTLGWTLRRAGLGILILAAMIVLGAWLMYAGIEPDEASANSPDSGTVQQHAR
ncbi:MAG TPA: hypothetical protein VG900_04835 [Hyphomicrobiaceae bacterium]|nr:hypothetical protein [Hyphomicrobiaceae bacterium]